MNISQNNLAPIVLFTYNRPNHTKITVENLLKNELAELSDLIIFSDAAKSDKDIEDVIETRNYLKTINGFSKVEIIHRHQNFGLAKNISNGVTEILNKYGKIIVLEDDLITSPFFLKYMNEALYLYENEDSVISISGYVYPIKFKKIESFFIKGADCWGWATWKRGWDSINWNGKELLDSLKVNKLIKEFNFNNSYAYSNMLVKQIEGSINSWAILWYASAFLQNKLTLYPSRSLVYHNGNDESGTHFVPSNEFDVELSLTPIVLEYQFPEENLEYRKQFSYFFKYKRKIRILKSLFYNNFKNFKK